MTVHQMDADTPTTHPEMAVLKMALAWLGYVIGSITVYRDGTQTANFTAGVSAGLTLGTGVSWTV